MKNGSREPNHAPFRDVSINVYTKFEVPVFTHYEELKGDENVEIGVVWGIRGHPR